MIKVQFIRHATCLIEINGKSLLLDPMLADPGTLPAIPLARSSKFNPLIPLPVPPEELTANCDAVLVTLHHFDHFDSVAAEKLDRQKPLFCSPKDQKYFQRLGFQSIIVIEHEVTWEGLQFRHWEAHHGHGWFMKTLMGTSSSFLLKATEQELFITGDAIFSPSLLTPLRQTQPPLVIANAGAARFRWGRPITLSLTDLQNLHELQPQATIAAIHMDAINHCTESKANLDQFLRDLPAASWLKVPREGEMITY